MSFKTPKQIYDNDRELFRDALERFRNMPAATEEEQPLTEAEQFLKDYPDHVDEDGYVSAHPEAWFRAKVQSIGIPTIYHHCTFDNFKKPDSRYESVWKLALTWANHMGLDSSQPDSLLLFGGTGSGKTHLAVSAIKILVRHKLSPRFYFWREMIEDMRDKAVPDCYWNPHPILIDDVGAASDNQPKYILERVQYVIQHRLEHRKSMIITGNLKWPDEYIDRGIIDRRLASRFRYMGQVIRVDLDDYRMNENMISNDNERTEQDNQDDMPF